MRGETDPATRPRKRAARLYSALAVIAFGLALMLPHPPAAEPARRFVEVASVNGAIGPALADFLTARIKEAPGRGAAAFVIRMDTPGGLVTSMRSIVQAILAADIPVIVYVAPDGAHAASAGTYILLASHVAAMAPGTNLGAATPIEMGGTSPAPAPDGKDKAPSSKPAGDAAPPGAADLKAVNDMVAFIKSIAELRGRNAAWAERAVRRAETLTAAEALKANVIDLIAPDLPSLLAEVDGRAVKLAHGETRLETQGAKIVEAQMGWTTRLLMTLTDPNIAFIFMTLGMYGLIFELSSPGAVLPGILGAVSLLIGLYAMSVLPVNAAGLALLALGVVLMLAEAFTPGLGVLGLGGVISFGLGATFLYDSALPEFRLALPVILTMTALTGGFLLLVVGLAVSALRRPVVTGREDLMGAHALVLDWDGRQGHVRLQGERWQARAETPLTPGAEVIVTGLDGLVVTVAPQDKSPPGRPRS